MESIGFFEPNIYEMLVFHFFRGALRFSDVMSAGSDVDRNYIRDIQYKLQFDDPINIQFTSVSLVWLLP